MATGRSAARPLDLRTVAVQRLQRGGLLYFAAYVGIADTAERRWCVASVWWRGKKKKWNSPRPAQDWARLTSVVRRDVFYYGNLPLGETVAAELLACERVRRA